VFVPPQLATLVGKPPSDEGWVHEIKFDGYRLLALIDGSAVRLFTRAANDWSARFPPLARENRKDAKPWNQPRRSSSIARSISPGGLNGYSSVMCAGTPAAADGSYRSRNACTKGSASGMLAWLAKLKVKNALIDGEAVHAAADGSLSFHALQNALSTGKLDRLRYYAFDLLHLDGIDLRSRPLLERKTLLQDVLRNAPPGILYSEHFAGTGEEILHRACHLALEGIVSKRSAARSTARAAPRTG